MNTHKQIAITLGCLAVLFAISFILLSVTQATTTQREVYCILKNVDGTWSVLDDAYHDNYGCTSVSQTSTYVQVNYISYDAVIWGDFGEDNALLNQQIQVGGSYGLSYSFAYFYDETGTLVNPNTVTGGSDNFVFRIVGNDY